MKKGKRPFWRSKSLEEMTPDEWESICDGCGVCCLQKIENPTTNEITLTSVSCAFLDTTSCRCTIYEARLSLNAECLELEAGGIGAIEWLPETCAYRRLREGQDLEWWHPLISGDPDTVHKAGISIRNRAISEQFVHAEDIRRMKSDGA